MFWLLQHSGTCSIPFPVLCLNSAPAHPLAIFGKCVDLFFLVLDLIVLQLWEVQEQKEVNEAEGHKRNFLLRWRSYHPAVWTFMGRNSSMYCRTKQKQLDGWCGGQTEHTHSWEQACTLWSNLDYNQVFTVCDTAALILVALSNKPDRWITVKCFLSQLKQRNSWDASGTNSLPSQQWHKRDLTGSLNCCYYIMYFSSMRSFFSTVWVG